MSLINITNFDSDIVKLSFHVFYVCEEGEGCVGLSSYFNFKVPSWAQVKLLSVSHTVSKCRGGGVIVRRSVGPRKV